LARTVRRWKARCRPNNPAQFQYVLPRMAEADLDALCAACRRCTQYHPHPPVQVADPALIAALTTPDQAFGS
jgi:hypothetical protein